MLSRSRVSPQNSSPGGIAAQLALWAVDEWLAAHPNSNMRVVFTLLPPADVAHYTQALSVVFPSVAAETPKKLRPLILSEVVEKIKNADAIIVRAGAGMSVDAVYKELGLSPTVSPALYPGVV